MPAKTLYLTFDDGPKSVGTSGVLDVLKELKIPAAFFVMADSGMITAPALQKQLYERMGDEGHGLGTHGYDHIVDTEKEYQDTYGDLSDPGKRKKFEAQFSENEKHFQKLSPAKHKKFEHARLPGMGFNFPVLVNYLVNSMKLKHYAWDFEFAPKGANTPWLKAENWQGVQDVLATYPSMPNDGWTVLLHDGHWSSPARLTVLRELLQKLKTNYNLVRRF